MSRWILITAILWMGRGLPADIYQSGGIPARHMRQHFLGPQTSGELARSADRWLSERMRIGLSIRPRFESRNNLNFSGSNPESVQRTLQMSQIWFLVQANEKTDFKLTLQDSRVWGGESEAKGDDRGYFFPEMVFLNRIPD